jgi:hypothetical protein
MNIWPAYLVPCDHDAGFAGKERREAIRTARIVRGLRQRQRRQDAFVCKIDYLVPATF